MNSPIGYSSKNLGANHKETTVTTLNVKVSERTKDGKTYFEGTVALPGAKPTKLVRKSTGTTLFSTRSALTTSARNFAKQFGAEADLLQSAKQSVKKAAKKSVKRSSKK